MSGLLLGVRIRAGLSALRFKARASLFVRGSSSMALTVVILALVSFGLDRTLRLSWDTRATALVLALTVLAVVAFKRLLRPLTARLDDVELAREVERTHRSLGWRLLSAVQFAEPSWEPGPEVSIELAECTVRDAEKLARGISFGDAVPGAPIALSALRGALVLGAALLLVFSFPETAKTWLLRNVLLQSKVEWPRDTHLSIEKLTAAGVVVKPREGTSTYVVPRGVDLSVIVLAEGEVPKRVYLDTEKTEEGGTDELLAMDELRSSGWEVSCPTCKTDLVVPMSEAKKWPMQLVECSSCSDSFLPPPPPEKGEGLFRATLERVTSGFTFTVKGGDGLAGPFEVRVLHRPWIEALELDVTPPEYTGLPRRTFPLESSNVSLPRGTRVELRTVVSKPLRRAHLNEFDIDRPIEDQIAFVHTSTITRAPEGFTASFDVQRTSIFEVELYDTDTLSLEQPTRFTVVSLPDQSPAVSLRIEGVGLNVTPEATIRFRAAAQDDYGVALGALKHLAKVGGEKKPIEGERELPLATGEEATGILELSELKLKPKMALTLWAEATDTDPAGPNVGVSPGLQLRIVTSEQLLNELLRRIHEQRLELERMISQEEQLAQGLSGADKATLERAPGAQRDVARTVLRASRVLDGVVEEMRSNKILDASTWRRLTEQVVKPLERLHDGKLTDAGELAESAAEAEGASQVLAMGMAGSAAAEVARELRIIVDRMGRLEELAELIALLKRIIRDQRELMEEGKRGGQ